MLGLIAKKVFGTRNDRIVKSLRPLIARVNQYESALQAMSDEELRGKTALFKQRLANGELLEELKSEAFAVTREAARRVLNMRHFDMQLIGGAVLHEGKIAEMKTGEGKTLVATLPAYLNALTGKGVHVVTVNDYLAKRDAEWMGRLYNFLGLSVGVVYANMPDEEKHRAYSADITYGQNNEFGFDYLRDNMKFHSADQYQRLHHYAIVDEVDSILVDEARTPLIISGPAEESTNLYQTVNKIIPQLQKETHYQVDLKTKQPSLTDAGVVRVEELLEIQNLYDPKHIDIIHHVNQALKAHTTLERDVDYVVKDGQIIIVDEFTGRLMSGRRWSDGLHQAIEAKEGVKIARENKTLATITFQNYFRMYEKLAGMTGTADTEAVEFKEIYNLEVVSIPTNRPMIRNDVSDRVFRTRKEKYEGVIKDIIDINKKGQPVLVGTISIEQSESLAKLLKAANVTHNVLNAKQHEREAEIVAQAGRFGAVTISTNMAGRGTDIVLGGNPEFLATSEAKTRDRQDPAFKQALEKYVAICAEEKERVRAVGGLHILGTERHESRRIDNQLRGRSGRQGDPGSSQFYVSLEDDLMMRFGGDRIQAIMQRLGWDEGVSIDGNLISHSIETAQKRVESFHFDARKHLLQYDNVLNKQRQVIYHLRSKVLKNDGVRNEIIIMLEDLLEDATLTVCDERVKPLDWNLQAIIERVKFLTKVDYSLPTDIRLDTQVIFDQIRKDASQFYAQHVEQQETKLRELQTLTDEASIVIELTRSKGKSMDYSTIEQDTMLEVIDHYWLENLQTMDHLREGIGLRGYGQKNPLHEYQKEGFLVFQQMLSGIKETVVRKLFYYELPDPKELVAHIQAEERRRAEMEKRMQMVHQSPEATTDNAAITTSNTEKSLEQQRAKLDAQKKARRKAR